METIADWHYWFRGLVPSYLYLYSVAKDEVIQRARFALPFLLVPYPVAEVTSRAARAYPSSHKRCTC